MYCCSVPPPQVQKIVGAAPEFIASWISGLYDWFSIKSRLMVSPGWLFSKDETRFCTIVLAGLGPVVTSHIVAAVLVEVASSMPAAEPHAVRVTVAAAAAAVTASQ